MNYCAIQQNGVVSREDMRSSFASGSATMFMPELHRRREAVVCPKPRRVGLLDGTNTDPRPLHWQHSSRQAELSDSKAGSELLEIFLAKGGHGSERSGTNTSTSTTQLGLSPPFFSGSPPSRVSNPLIQDSRFREEKLLPTITSAYPSSSTAAQPARKGGCVRSNFGNKPVVRIEGFDCLDRDRSRNCRIPTLA